MACTISPNAIDRTAMSVTNASSTNATSQINVEMQAILDRYLPNRRPMAVDDYDWELMRPESVDREFLEAVGFVTLVESNPKDPGGQIIAAADRSNAPWLRRFITQTWLPEEGMHHAPFKEYLIRSGAYDEGFLDAEIAKVIDRGFVHGTGYTDLEVATYGWLQELITWRFYDSMSDYLRSQATPDEPADPVMLKILADIAKQENFHRHVYLTGAKTILKHQPERKGEVMSAVAEFIMPGHHMAPDWQPKAPVWSKKFKFPLKQVIHDIAHGMVFLTDYRGLGQATILYGARNTIHWYLKPLVAVLRPLSRPYSSPVNYLTGRFIAHAF